MKIHGITLECPAIETVIIPRQSGPIIFKCRALNRKDEEDFEKICPSPEPPVVLLPGGATRKDVNSKGYQEKLSQWAQHSTNWLILKSLDATEGLEWDQVDLSNPETWDKYREELSSAGLSTPEIVRIIEGVTSANGLNQTKIDEAQKSFLASQAPG